MSHHDPKPPQNQAEIALREMEEQSKQTKKAFGNYLEAISPWLLEFGNWIFGGLIAFNLVVVASLLTVGPAHPAILVSVTAFACALPLNLTGLFILKLLQDMKDIKLDELMQQAFKDADFPNVDAYFPDTQGMETFHKKRRDVTLRYSMGLASLSMTLTLIGLVAALYYMAWWIAALFVAMVILSLALLLTAMAHTFPPETDAEKELKRRYREQSRHIKAQHKTDHAQ